MVALRACGARVRGGVYAETHLSREGLPVYEFLIDPPLGINPTAMGLSPIGVRLIEKGGITHVLDWVGSEYYPNVADMVEEIRRMGISRRLPSTLDFGKLTPGSMIFLAHARAIIENAGEYFAERGGFIKEGPHWFETDEDTSGWWCPQGHPSHLNPVDPPPMCASLWWENLSGGEDSEGDRGVKRTMPAFSYRGLRSPDGVKPRYAIGLFAGFPINNIAVINDPDGDSHEKALKRVVRTSLPVSLELE